jgi:hypothetical protein
MRNQRGRTNTLSNQFAEVLAAAGLRNKKTTKVQARGEQRVVRITRFRSIASDIQPSAF